MAAEVIIFSPRPTLGLAFKGPAKILKFPDDPQLHHILRHIKRLIEKDAAHMD